MKNTSQYIPFFILFIGTVSLAESKRVAAPPDTHSQSSKHAKANEENFPLEDGKTPQTAMPYPVGGINEAVWIQMECRTEACLWVMKDPDGGILRKVWYKSAVKQAKHEEPAAETKPAKADLEIIKKSEVKTKTELDRFFEAAGKTNKDIVILQVGNLEGCGPCKNLNNKLRASDLAKDKGVSIIDFNFLNNQTKDSAGYDLTQYMFSSLDLPAALDANKKPLLPYQPAFPYPYVYIFHIEKGKTEANKFSGRHGAYADGMTFQDGSTYNSMDKINEAVKELRVPKK